MYLSYVNSLQKSYYQLSNWDDIVDLCGKDRATGEGAETNVEADEIMTSIEESIVIDLDSETQGQEELNIG